MNVEYIVNRGRSTGAILAPHKHKCGRYVVSATSNPEDYRYHPSLTDALADLFNSGDSLRMSNQTSKVTRSPSLIRAYKITVIN